MNLFDPKLPVRWKSTLGQWIPSWYRGRPVGSRHVFRRTADIGPSASSWVYTMIDRLVTGARQVPWVAFKQGGESVGTGTKSVVKHRSWVPDPDSDVAKVVESPNDHWSRSDLIGFAVASLSELGESLQKAVFVRNDSLLYELWPMDVRGAKPVPPRDGDGWIEAWKIGEGPDAETIPFEEAVFAKRMPNVHDPMRGLSPLRAIRSSVELDLSHLRHNRAAVDNGATPGLIFNDPIAKSPLQIEANKQRIKTWFSGPANAREPLVLAGEAQAQPYTMTPSEMDWIDSRKFTLAEIAAAFGFLVEMFSPDAAKYSNLEQAVAYYWYHGIIPVLDILRDAFAMRLYTRDALQTQWLTFDLSGVNALRHDLEARSKIFATLVQNGTPPQIAAEILELNLSDLPEGAFFKGKWVSVAEILASRVEE